MNNYLDHSNRKILVVDDNSDNLAIIGNYLKSNEYNVSALPSGHIALERVETIMPDLIILDVQMPEIDGFEVCKELKKREAVKSIPVIFLTALDDIASISKAFEMGGMDYLTKPVNKKELLARVLTQLDNYIYKNKLEEEVTKRTFELKESNKLLKREVKKHKETEENLQTILNSIGDAVIATNLKGKIIRMNPIAESLTGVIFDKNKKLYINQVYNVVEDGQFIDHSQLLKNLINGDLREYVTKYDELHDLNDHVYRIASSMSPIKTDSGKIDGLVLVFRDVTQDYLMREKLHKSEERLDLAMFGANNGIWDWDLNNNEIFFDSRYFTMAGYKPEGFHYTIDEWEKHIHPLDISRTKLAVKQYLAQTSESYNIEYRFKRKDGSYMWVQSKGKIVSKDIQGNPLRFTGIHADISHRKKIEKELGDLKKYLTNIIDSMPSLIIGVDFEGKVTQWNKTAEDITGITAKEANGETLLHVFPQMKIEMSEITESIKTKEIKKKQNLTDSVKKEMKYEDITIYPLIANGVEGAVIRVDDVTENVKLKELMIQSEKMLSVGGLAAGMAHEINNPLAGIIQTIHVMTNRLTNLEMPANKMIAQEIGISVDLIKSYMEKRDIIRMFETINESGKRVSNIVENMLSFARKSDQSTSLYDPLSLLKDIMYLAGSDYDLKKNYDFKEIKIVEEFEDNLPMIQCDKSKIQQVLLNILRNSAQAMYENIESGLLKTPTIYLRLKNNKAEKILKIEIEDNGPGMDENTKKRVFEPFYTTKAKGIGTGLGLSVSYFIITENHKGKLTVESELLKGTKFIISLPYSI